MPSFAKSLSLHRDIQPFAEYAVTPFVGVWIETIQNNLSYTDNVSHPSWVCGLKQSGINGAIDPNKVTPFVGVWIETMCRTGSHRTPTVTPFVGVWIETHIVCAISMH